ncbi:ankyrin repeat domain-containing protein 46-like [Mytilus californianus]|uniref:ankyrin repeat domain-containing protein 46-like n=1 Tax=Mytilus californianus TaxID=6549 RepID=UPI002245F0A4|nr:ankyrin repeat domain-containing protein 46-like [Mytilus californianus]
MKRIDVVELLLKRKADVSLVDAEGNTALHLAVSCGSLPVTVILVEHGSSLEARNTKGNTAYVEAKAEDKNRQKKRKRIGHYEGVIVGHIDFFKDNYTSDL